MTPDKLRTIAAVHATGDVQEAMLEAADEIERLQQDAKRYRWLRSDGIVHINFAQLSPDTSDVGLDTAVDAAIGEQE